MPRLTSQTSRDGRNDVPSIRALCGCLLGFAIFQGLSAWVGMIELLLAPQWFAPMLQGTPFVEQTGLAALLLGAVGAVQWAAVVVHLRQRAWLPAAHTIAGAVMLGWIAGECLVLDSFQWMHALWGGIGAIQVLLVAALLGAFRPWEKLA